MIEIKNLSFSYDENPVLNGIDLKINKGDFLAVMGPNGCGKSTLLYTLNGVIPHVIDDQFSGDVFVDGENTREKDVSSLSQKVGLLLQEPDSQLFAFTAEEEIAFALENLGVAPSEIRKRITKSLKDVELDVALDRETWRLSEGQKQRLALAAVLAMRPDILVLDEPCAELDLKGKEEIYNLLRKLNNKGKTIVVVEHDTEKVFKFASRVVILGGGKAVADGDPKDILRKPKLLKDNGIQPLNHFKSYRKVKPVKSKKTAALTNKLVHRYEGAEENSLNGIDLEIKQGEFVIITGPNGSGKTTLVKTFNKLIKPMEGRIEILERGIDAYTQKEITKNVMFSFQNPSYQIFERSVEKEVLFSLNVLEASESKKRARLKKVAKDFKLEALLQDNPLLLSTGEKQRVALASAIAPDSNILILDEPTAYIDFHTKLELLETLKDMKQDGKTIIVITHDLNSFRWLADKEILIKGGQVK